MSVHDPASGHSCALMSTRLDGQEFRDPTFDLGARQAVATTSRPTTSRSSSSYRFGGGCASRSPRLRPAPPSPARPTCRQAAIAARTAPGSPASTPRPRSSFWGAPVAGWGGRTVDGRHRLARVRNRSTPRRAGNEARWISLSPSRSGGARRLGYSRPRIQNRCR